MSQPKTYFTKNVYSTNEFLRACSGKKLWRRMIVETLRKIRCKILGHYIVHQKWINAENPIASEWHIGCIYCPKFKTEPFT